MSTGNWIGSIGVTITLVAYFCMSFRWMSAHGRIFFLMNTVGSALTCFSSWLVAYWPFFVLEGTWALVSLVGFLRAGNNRMVKTEIHP